MTEDVAGAVAERVLLPLLAGGEVRPLPPIGSGRAASLAGHQDLVPAGGALDEVRARRLRVARTLLPVDALGDLTQGEWLMAFALNDLLQATNPTLGGWFGADRPERLLEMVQKTLDAAGPPRTLGETVARHATFARLPRLTRVDTHVSWWVGSEVFRGAPPPRRLTLWSDLRRVRQREERVGLGDMTVTQDFHHDAWLAAAAKLLAATPLTDLSWAERDAPPFAFTGATMALIATPAGRNLARRAIDGERKAALVRLRLEQAVGTLPAGAARDLGERFLGELGVPVKRAG